MSQTSIYGIDNGLENVSNLQLQKLLSEIGRNGETNTGVKIRETIESILSERAKNGVIVTDGSDT